MNRRSTALVLCLAGLVFPLPATASDVVFTQQPRFRIPYHSEPAELKRLGAREIQLYVSTDHGLSWTLAQSVPPTAGRFAYEAPRDGEYWFAVRTVDGLGRLHPQAGEITPGLKVAVDSRPPNLALALDRSGDRVRLSWRASDVNLDPSTLKLEYHDSATDSWRTLSVSGQAAGQTTWDARGHVRVRGTVADQAGNTGSDEAELEAGTDRYAPLPENPDLEGPIADHQGELPVHRTSSRSESSPEQIADNSNPAKAEPKKAGLTPVTQRQTVAAAGPRPITAPKPADGSETSNGTSTPPAAGAPTASEAPRTEIVNTRAFNVGYQIDEVGPSGLGAVEFYITEDGGQKWYRYGNDPDLQSPFRIDVPAEGTYGFKVRARSGVGLAADPPKPGEQPAVTVIVDQTPPTATVQVAPQSPGQNAPVLPIRWKVQDANPRQAKAIDLAHGPSPNGPWTPIVTELDDQGGFDWTMSSIPAAKIFVRLTARDAAGNVGHAVTQQPATVDLTLPSARITEIEIQPIE